jgi:hypothetical protein
MGMARRPPPPSTLDQRMMQLIHLTETIQEGQV